MRTNIDIDDQLMSDALAAGPFKTKKEAVEAGLLLLKRQAAMRELIKLGGTVSWGWGDEERLDGTPNWRLVEPAPGVTSYGRVSHVAEPQANYAVNPPEAKVAVPVETKRVKSRARR